MAFDIKKAVAKAAKLTDLNQASKGGGTWTPPAAGSPGLRFVSYVELGPQNEIFNKKPRIRAQAKLGFELHGKKWPLSDNGQPQRLTITLSAPMPGEQPSEKSHYYKLFKAMNYSGKYQHFAQMLGQAFVGTVYHRADEKDPNKVYAGFKDPNSGVFNIRAPIVEDEDGEPRKRNVPETISDLRLFLWQDPDADQWASIYIDGEYDDGKSKNTFQEAIKASPAYEGSPIEALLAGDPDTGDDDDPEEAKAAAKKPAAKPKGTVKPKAKPAPEPADDDDDEDGTNAIPDDNPLADLEDDEDE
ncbi:hypothetical protein [Achromobacter mucicolens]|uniref:hypothetical protein n=1 Tax=Achromobacter mucicolens TaxID=1389922 RepID=UPI002FDFE819